MNALRRSCMAMLVLVLAGFATHAVAAAECAADLRARLMSDDMRSESVVKVFAVEVDTQEDCAVVYGDLTVTERLFNGEEITTTRRGSRKVTSDATTYKVNYEMARDSTLVDWKMQLVRCVVCGTE